MIIVRMMLLFVFSFHPSVYSQFDRMDDSNVCTFVDLRSLGRLTEINRHQGKMDWCYAHTAADLVQFHFGTEPLSASHIALEYAKLKIAKTMHRLFLLRDYFVKEDKNIQFLEPETGFIEMALANSFRAGFCPRILMPDETISRINLTTGERKSIDFEDAMYDILKNLKDSDLSSTDRMYEFPLIEWYQLKKIINSTPREKIFSTISEISCRDKIIKLSPVKIIQEWKNGNIFDAVDRELNKNNIIAIDYTAKVLRDKTQAHKITKWLHTSTLIGRRWNEKDQECEYLIRNSAGSSCLKYDPSYGCDKGNIWIPKKYLHQSLLRITYIKL